MGSLHRLVGGTARTITVVIGGQLRARLVRIYYGVRDAPSFKNWANNISCFAVFHMSEQVQQTAQLLVSYGNLCLSSLFTGDLTVRDVLSRSELYLTSPIRANFHSLRPVPAPPSGGATGVARESAGKKIVVVLLLLVLVLWYYHSSSSSSA